MYICIHERTCICKHMLQATCMHAYMLMSHVYMYINVTIIILHKHVHVHACIKLLYSIQETCTYTCTCVVHCTCNITHKNIYHIFYMWWLCTCACTVQVYMYMYLAVNCYACMQWVDTTQYMYVQQKLYVARVVEPDQLIQIPFC